MSRIGCCEFTSETQLLTRVSECCSEYATSWARRREMDEVAQEVMMDVVALLHKAPWALQVLTLSELVSMMTNLYLANRKPPSGRCAIETAAGTHEWNEEHQQRVSRVERRRLRLAVQWLRLQPGAREIMARASKKTETPCSARAQRAAVDAGIPRLASVSVPEYGMKGGDA